MREICKFLHRIVASRKFTNLSDWLIAEILESPDCGNLYLRHRGNFKGGIPMDYITSAAYLYDGGWRKEDKEQLIAEYGLSEEDAQKICAELAKLEEE